VASVAEWGRWPSPVTAAIAAAGATRVGEPGFVGGVLHWVSTPPDAAGSSMLMAATSDAEPWRVSPEGRSVRSRLYLYGAGSWCATPRGIVVVDAATQALELLEGASRHRLGTTASAERTGDPTSVPGTDWVVFIAEPADEDGPRALCALEVTSGRRVTLLADPGFLGDLAVSPDGGALAWIRWPDRTMPWDAAELWVGRLEPREGALVLAGALRRDGGAGASIGQPTWTRTGGLAYVSEAAGYWQPWVLDEHGAARRLCARRAEFQRPRWTTCRWLVALGRDALGCAFVEGGHEHVGVLDADGDLVELSQPCVRIDGLAGDGDRLGWVGATTQGQGAVYLAAPVRAVPVALVAPADPVAAAPAPREFHVEHGDAVLSGAYWPPLLAGTEAPSWPPPLVLSVHPGPTGAVDTSYAPLVHLLSSHGFAVAALDYSGSTGHGRAHRERLNGGFGILDVDECVAAARRLAELGLADASASFIRGTSAGGTTALLALSAGTFAGAVAWYPASDLSGDEEGFEAGYLELLCGPAGATRGPIARAGDLQGRALVVQGAEDPVVAPASTRALVERLRASGVDVAYLEVPDEGHGFRGAAGRESALGAELDFYVSRTLRRSGVRARYDAGEATDH